MTFLEAVKSGRPFKRPEDVEYLEIDEAGGLFTQSGALPMLFEYELVAEDWENV